jgi:soluble lytic murein transglycosylase-like protein
MPFGLLAEVFSRMKFSFQFVLLLGLAAVSASASDLAILQNGNSIRHDHRRDIGAVTRLYLGADSDSFIDVPTKEIDHFEKDTSPPPLPAASPAPKAIASSLATFPAASTRPTANAKLRNAPTPPLSSQQLNDVINNSSDLHHLDPDLVNSVIHAESGFNQHARSPKGAQGLMQLMPGTASALGVENAYDAQANVEGGTKYLRELLEKYNFDLIKALAAYNAGPQRVEKYHGVPPYYETQAYIARIIKDFNRKKLAERKAAAAQKLAETKANRPGAAKQASIASPGQQASR